MKYDPDNWTIADSMAANKVLKDLARGEDPIEVFENGFAHLLKCHEIEAHLRNPESQFRKDYEAFVEASGERCPLLESVRREDAYWAEWRNQLYSMEIPKISSAEFDDFDFDSFSFDDDD